MRKFDESRLIAQLSELACWSPRLRYQFNFLSDLGQQVVAFRPAEGRADQRGEAEEIAVASIATSIAKWPSPWLTRSGSALRVTRLKIGLVEAHAPERAIAQPVVVRAARSRKAVAYARTCVELRGVAGADDVEHRQP